MKTFLILVAALATTPAWSGPNARLYRDIHLPTQAVLEKQAIVNPAAAGTTDVLSSHAGNTSSAAASASSFVAQPDVPRNLVVTPGGTTADVAACTVTVSGTDFHGGSISEGFVFAANASSGTTGLLAFKTVTSVWFPASCEDSPYGASWSIGYGEKLGLKRCLAQKGDFAWSSASGVYSATRATITVGTTVAYNTADFNESMDGAADFDAYFVQSFRCFP